MFFAYIIISHLNSCVGKSFKCFACSELCFKFVCSSILVLLFSLFSWCKFHFSYIFLDQCRNHRRGQRAQVPPKIWTLKILSSKIFALLFHRFNTTTFRKKDVKEAYLSHLEGKKVKIFPNHGGVSLVSTPYLYLAPLISKAWLRHCWLMTAEDCRSWSLLLNNAFTFVVFHVITKSMFVSVKNFNFVRNRLADNSFFSEESELFVAVFETTKAVLSSIFYSYHKS